MNKAAINQELQALQNQNLDDTASYDEQSFEKNDLASSQKEDENGATPEQTNSSPQLEELTGLVDPTKSSLNPDMVRESDLTIARNLRRLEIHRYEIASALNNLKEQEIGKFEEDETEIELQDLEEHYAEHIKRVEKLKIKKKKLAPAKKILQNLEAFTQNLQGSKNTDNAKNLFNVQRYEEFRYKASLAWHKWRYDNAIEERLFRPQKNQALISSTEPQDEIQNAGIDHAEDQKNTEQQQTNLQSDQPDLCAPTRLVSWSLECLADYQEDGSFRHYCFIDPKAGHARTVLMASEKDFRAIFGIETDPELVDDALMNIAQYPRTYMTQREIEIINTEVSPMNWPHHPLVVHIFKPDSAEWLSKLVEGLSASFYESPRQIYLVLIGNEHKNEIENIPFLQSFTPTSSQLKTMSLMSPYDIDFYYTVVTTQRPSNQ